MTFDTVELDRDLRRRPKARGLDGFKWLTLAALVAFSLYMFLWEFANVNSDLYKHAVIASEFDFTDLHSITSRLAYPLWHLCVAALFQLGVPLGWAAALLCALCKGLAFLLVRRYLFVMTRNPLSNAALALLALLLMLVTPIRLLLVNEGAIYRGVGSPTVWHNPTQLAVLVTAMLCVPYMAHCWYAFERMLPERGPKTMLPWRKVIALAALLMLNLSSKPTFLQALLPAAALFFLIQWIRHPKNSRYFAQIILAFLPAAAYFLLQYLYYTGVVVPYTSGVEFGLSLETVWLAIRNMLLMAAFPLFALVCCRKRGILRDRMLLLSLLMAGFSMVEAMCLRETGVRVNHGNFNWASMSSAFFLWVTVLPHYLDSIGDFRAWQARLQAADVEGTLDSAALRKERAALSRRSLCYFVSFVLLVWHVYSSLYYPYYLLTTGNVF